MPTRFLLLDADYTLLDFPADMTQSFQLMYGAQFASQRPYSPALLECYDACNNRAWDRFERRACTALWNFWRRPALAATRRQ